MVLAASMSPSAAGRTPSLAGAEPRREPDGPSRRAAPASASALAPANSAYVAPSTRAASPQPSPTELAAATAVVTAVLGDPMALALALQSQLKDQGARDTEARVNSSSREQQVADGLRLDQLEKAAKALEKASRRAPPWVKKLIGAVLSAVGTIASIAGGAGAALIAVGAALVVAAKLAEMLLNKLAEAGLISEKAAAITAAVVKVAAAVAAACVGQVGGLANAAGAAGQAAATAVEVGKTAAEIVKTVVEMCEAAATIAFAGVDMNTAVRMYQAQMANIMAEEWGFEVDGSLADTEAAADTFEQIHKAYARVAKVANGALATQEQTRLQAARSVA